MLGDDNAIAFIGTETSEEARLFYEDVLGLRLVIDESSALVFYSSGTMIRISKVHQFEPTPFTVLGWEVNDIQTRVDELSELGVVFERFPGLEQDESGIATFPDGTQVGWFKDPDKNILSLTHF